MKYIRFTNTSQRFSAGSESFLRDSMRFIHDTLSQLGIVRSLVLKTELLAEEVIVQLMQHAVLHIRIRNIMGDVSVTLDMRGEEFDLFAGAGKTISLGEEDGSDTEEAIRSILMRSFGENFKYQHKNGVNRVRLLTEQAEQSMLMLTMAALVLGLLFGLLAKLVFPELVTAGLCTYLLNPVKTIFMNSLKIIIAPVVFFSIVTCISQFNSILENMRFGLSDRLLSEIAELARMHGLDRVVPLTGSFCLGRARERIIGKGATSTSPFQAVTSMPSQWTSKRKRIHCCPLM